MAEPSRFADRVTFRLAAFGAVLVVVLSTGFGIGRLTGGPDLPGTATTPAGVTQTGAESGSHNHGAGDPTAAGHDSAGHDPAGHDSAGHDSAGHDSAGHVGGGHDAGSAAQAVGAAAGMSVGGLAVSSSGLTLVPHATAFRAGARQPLRFHIAAPGGRPVTAFAVVHDKPLHLVIARRDLTGYQHLHPTMSPDGTWQTDLTLGAAGTWRAYADFIAIVDGAQTAVTLGVDLTVAGDYRPVALPAATRQASVAGFTVAYDGAPRTGATQPLLVRVTGADGRPADLQPYLGAYGHLVVLREGDLGYVHVHPEPQRAEGAVKFWLAAPGPGRYRMFFDFQVADKVHTAAFTATVS